MTSTDHPASAQPRATYHHGRLREALIEATVSLAQEIGPEQVSLREVARRAGVSPGAPFRHFPTKATLMTAVAEEAIGRMRAEINEALYAAAQEDPLVRFSAIAAGYLRFVLRNPTHFRILSDRRLLEWSETLKTESAAAQAQMSDALSEAIAKGLLRHDDLRGMLLDARAISYGVARTFVDGQMLTWGVTDQEVEAEMEAVLRRFVQSLAIEPGAHDLSVLSLTR
ncbi:TetR/AcrR family transcriptional regulator [Phenylobacterium sp.]|uniref:TetR/AcrR family transcriptional regulator n=1 Tax=Phenylobacterium sp. TaxID=1871053 RepID=UPI00286D67E5|nr:TetR/AcrR family transcriptional regulator [Phenylobacterium sp.]